MNDLSRRIEEYEATIKNREDAATKQIEGIWSSIQQEIDAAREAVRHHEALIARAEAERVARKQDILLNASEVTASTRCLLADAKHQLAAISTPVLRLPTECIAEIMKYFNVDDTTTVLLLVCKRWNAIAKAMPQLWSKIAIIGDPWSHRSRTLKEAHACHSIEHLSSVLSLAKDVPLDIELCAAHRTTPLNQSTSVTRSGEHVDGLPWLKKGLELLVADGRSRRWRSLYITPWYNMNGAPFKGISGPFDNLRLLYIRQGSSYEDPAHVKVSFLPLLDAVVQSAPHLSTIDSNNPYLIQRVNGWKDRIIWRNIKSYHSVILTNDFSFLSEASRMTDLSVYRCFETPRNEPVSLPNLCTLALFQSCIETLKGFRLPVLETLLLIELHSSFEADPGTITIPSATSVIIPMCWNVRVLQCFSAPTLNHLHITSPPHSTLREARAWQTSFVETFNGSQFMPRPTSLHLEAYINDSQLLSALFSLPEIKELKLSLPQPLGSKFWTALTPRGADGRKKPKQYCHQLRIIVIVEMKSWRCRRGQQVTSKDRSLELAVKMATAREQEGQALTHLLFKWDDRSKNEVLGSFSTLPVHPSPLPWSEFRI